MFVVSGLLNRETQEVLLVVNGKHYEWGDFSTKIPSKTLKAMYLDTNRDIDGILNFLQEILFINDEDNVKRLTTQQLMGFRNTNPFYLYVLTLVAYWCLYVVNIDNRDFDTYTPKELFAIAEKDEFVACLVENMIDLFGEINLINIFPTRNDTSILTGLDSQNKPIYKEGSKNDIGTEEETPKWLC